MAKLTEKQANILRQALSGSIIMHRIGMYSDSWHFEGGEHIDGRSALGLHTRGLIRPHIDRDPSGIDYPYMISDAGREAIAAYDAKHAAIAANVSADAATDAWIIENAGADGAELSEPAPDAAQTAAAGDEMAELMYEAGGIIEEAIKMRREKDEQIAQLTRDLEAARTEAAALREALAEMPKYRLGQEVSVGEYSPAIGKVEEIRITDDGIDYSVYVEGESMAYTWSEGKVSPADPDAALAAARQTDA